jgi:hypothetical protein
MGTVRKDLGKSANSKRLFEDSSAGTMKHQYSEGLHPLSTKESVYFDSNSAREEMRVLKSIIEKAHDIKLEGWVEPP